MAKLFGKNKLRDRAETVSTDDILAYIPLVEAWRADYHTGTLRTDNETAREQAYSQVFFKTILGYDEKPTDPYTFQPKAGTEQRGIPDAVIGHFETAGNSKNFSAVVELKGAGINLDRPQRGESNLSPVQQGFKYKPLYRAVPFVIVSNFWEFRLYNDNQLDYEVWTLDDLANPADDYLAFKSWYVLLRKENFTAPHGQSATERLLSDIRVEQEEVGKKFYQQYKDARLALIAEIQQFNPERRDDLDFVIAKAQKIIDRVIFAAFAEDKGLLPDHTLRRLKQGVISSTTGRRMWSALQDFFVAIDQGDPRLDIPDGYNGGLFAWDEALSRLRLGESALFKVVDLSGYNFDEDLSVTILGHIFEQSITDIEALKSSASNGEIQPNSSRGRRKKDGIYYTPDYIVRYIVENSLGVYLREHEERFRTEARLKEGIKDSTYATREHRAYVAYYEFLRNIKVVDPACGSGAFLVYVFDYLLAEHQRVGTILGLDRGAASFEQVYRNILRNNIYGVDLNEESVEIAKLSLWLKTALKGKKLTALDQNLKVGNSLIDDPAVAGDKAFNWQEQFPEVFSRGGFDVVVTNPPYGATFSAEEKKYLSKFDEFVPDYEAYIYFISLHRRIAIDQGVMSYIFPNTFLSNMYGRKFRSQFFNDYSVDGIADLSNDATFSDASVRTVILTARYIKSEYQTQLMKIDADGVFEVISTQAKADLLANVTNVLALFSMDDRFAAIIANIRGASTPLTQFFDVSQGLIPYDKYRGHSEETIKNRIWHAAEKKDETYRRELKGGDITRYQIDWNQKLWISYGDWLAAPRDPRFFRSPRILIREITGARLYAAWTDEEYYNTPSIINAVPHDGTPSIAILAIVNSQLMGWYHNATSPKARKGLFPKILVNDVRNLPVRLPHNDDLMQFAVRMQELTHQMHLELKRFETLISTQFGIKKWPARLNRWWTLDFADFVKALRVKLTLRQKDELLEFFEEYSVELRALDAEIQRTDREIDQLVYQLYELTPEEIALVEASV